MRADSSRVVSNELTKDEVWHGTRVLFVPANAGGVSSKSKGEKSYSAMASLQPVRPLNLFPAGKRRKVHTFTHTSSFRSLETTSSPSTSHAVCDSVSIFMSYNVVFNRPIAFRLTKGRPIPIREE